MGSTWMGLKVKGMPLKRTSGCSFAWQPRILPGCPGDPWVCYFSHACGGALLRSQPVKKKEEEEREQKVCLSKQLYDFKLQWKCQYNSSFVDSQDMIDLLIHDIYSLLG